MRFESGKSGWRPTATVDNGLARVVTWAGINTYNTWKKKADRFAEYVLTMFRPSEIYNGLKHNCQSLNQKFEWEDLVQWVTDQQNDGSIISKFRLMAIERRLHCLTSDYNKKRMLSEYYGFQNNCRARQFGQIDAV